jgi:hypothetical protein
LWETNLSATPGEHPARNTSRRLDDVMVIYLTISDSPMAYVFDRADGPSHDRRSGNA